MKTGLDYFIDQVRTLTKTKPPFTGAFTAQALYLLNQSITIIEGLNEIIRKQKLEIEKLKLELQGKKPRKSVTDPIRNAQIIEDHQSGMTMRQIGKKHGVTASRVYQILVRLGVRNATSRVEGLSNASNSERQGEIEGGVEKSDPANANGIGQNRDGGGGNRVGSGEGASGDIYRSRDQLDYADDRELPT